MSSVNRWNSAGSGHTGPFKTMKQRAYDKRAEKMPPLPGGSNVVGKAPDLNMNVVRTRNLALAEPRNDPRFTDINTMHPGLTGKFGPVVRWSRKSKKTNK